MSRRRRTTAKARSGKLARTLLMGTGVLLVLGIAGVIGGKLWIESYIRGTAFREFVSNKAGTSLHATGQFAPFQVSGLNFFCENFQAQGTADSAFADLRLEELRAEVSARRFFDGIWQINQISLQRLDVNLDGPRLASRKQIEAHQLAAPTSTGGGWLPNRVELAGATVREANLSWGAAPATGSFKGTQLKVVPGSQGAWSIAADAGRLQFPGLPAFDLKSAQILYRQPALFVQSAELELVRNAHDKAASGVFSGIGPVRLSGEIVPNEKVDLRIELGNLSVTPLLSEDWRARLHGNLTGEINIRGPLGQGRRPNATGKVQLIGGQLEALPVLEKIATFTQLLQYRRLALTKATADFRHEAGTLTVHNLVMESANLIRIEGGFTITNGLIDGVFQVGVTPASLQWLPGSREKVFTEIRGGYLWSPMRLSGMANDPKEDLSARLTAAVQGAVIDQVGNAVDTTIKTGNDAAKGILDLLLK